MPPVERTLLLSSQEEPCNRCDHCNASTRHVRRDDGVDERLGEMAAENIVAHRVRNPAARLPAAATAALVLAPSGRESSGVGELRRKAGADTVRAFRGGCRVKGSVRAVQWIFGMPQNFIDCDREQAFLMPPSLRDWLPADHLAWFVIESVDRLDLDSFYSAYRADGHGRAAYEPSIMVELILACVLDQCAVFARDRASLSPGHCLSGDHW